MRHQLMTFIFLFSLNSYAEVLQNPAKIGQEEERCLSEVIHSPIFKEIAPGMFHNYDGTTVPSMFENILSFCQCTISKRQKELDLKNSQNLGWYFRDKTKQLEAEDVCALSHFDSKLIDIYYTTITFTRLANMLQIKLQERYPASMKMVAHQGAFKSSLYCMQSQLLEKCSKIKSLETTYKCFETHLRNNSLMEKLEKSCPNFSTDELKQTLDAVSPYI